MIVYLLILITILFTAAGQLILKHGMNIVGKFPMDFSQITPFFIKSLSNRYVILSLVLAFLGSFTYMAAASKKEISYIYPFMSLSFVLVLISSVFLFNEHITPLRLIGVIIICLGVFLVSKS